MRRIRAKYNGPLSRTKIAEAMGCCLQNAGELVSDAKLLFNNRRYARAHALAILSFEELGKLPILARGLMLSRADKTSWRKFWGRFRSHVTKRDEIDGLETLHIFADKSTQSSFQKWVREYKAELAIERLKQLSLYVDSLSSSEITCPSKLFRRKHVSETILLAENRIKLFKRIHKLAPPGGFAKQAGKVKRQARRLAMVSPETRELISEYFPELLA